MIRDLFEDSQKRILKAFPERQLYLRSGGEVRYYHLGTKFQMAVFGVLAFLALWCLFTMVNMFLGNYILRPEANAHQRAKAEYQRLLEDSRAKEANARLMLERQRQTFNEVAKNLEEKHATISQMLRTNLTDVDTQVLPSTEYANSHVVMAPTIRDTIPRQARKKILKKTSLVNGLERGNSLQNIGDNQDVILAAAEVTTLERIERNRAIIELTDLSVQTILEEDGFGQGGLFVNLGDKDTLKSEDPFADRISSIQARVAEAQALDNALNSIPLGKPIAVDHYQTSKYGTRKDPFTKRPTFHEGIDFGAYRSAPIVATAGGTVRFSGRKGGYGRMVEIDHGHGFVTRYGHLNKTFVKRGQTVAKGDKIGGMGSTGRSTATHLHYEIHFQDRVYDPEKFLKAGTYVR